MEMPMKKLDSDNITRATVVFNPVAMAGKAGRYISIEKGPMAVSSPRMRMRLKYLLVLAFVMAANLSQMNVNAITIMNFINCLTQRKNAELGLVTIEREAPVTKASSLNQ